MPPQLPPLVAPTGLSYDCADFCWNAVGHATDYLAWAGASYYAVRSLDGGRWCATVGSWSVGTVFSVMPSATLGEGEYYGPTATLVVQAVMLTPKPTATPSPTPLPALPAPSLLAMGPDQLLWNGIEHARGYELRWRAGAGEWQGLSVGVSVFSHGTGGLPPGVTHEFQVRALGDGRAYSHSPWSASVNVTLPTPIVTATATPSATPTLAPRLARPAEVKFAGGNILCVAEVENALSYGLRLDGPAGASADAAQSSRAARGQNSACGGDGERRFGWFAIGEPQWGSRYCVRAIGDGIAWRDSEERCALAVAPTVTSTTTLTPTITATPLPTLAPRLARPAAVEVAGGQLRWSAVTGARGYSIRAVTGELPATRAAGATGSLTWQTRALAELPLADGYCVKANGDGVRRRNSEELCAAVASTPTATPGVGPTSTVTATATATVALEPLDAPGEITVTGGLVSWEAVPGATGYRLELRRAGARVLVAEIEAEAEAAGAAEDGETLVRYRLEGLEPDVAYVVDVLARGDGETSGDSVWSRSEEVVLKRLPAPVVRMTQGHPFLLIEWDRLDHDRLKQYVVNYGSRAPGETNFVEEEPAYFSPHAIHLKFSVPVHIWDATREWQVRVRAEHADSDLLHSLWSGPFTWYPPPTSTPSPTLTPYPVPLVYVHPHHYINLYWCFEYQGPKLPVAMKKTSPGGVTVDYLEPSLLLKLFGNNLTAFKEWVDLAFGDPASWFMWILDIIGNISGVSSTSAQQAPRTCFHPARLNPVPEEGDEFCIGVADVSVSLEQGVSYGPITYGCLFYYDTRITPTPTATLTPTLTPTPIPQLEAPAVVKFVGQTLCWKRVENASGYNISWSRAGPRGASDVSGNVDPDPCGTPGTDWHSRHYASPAWGENYCVTARGDGVRYLNSRARCTLAVQPTPAPPPTDTPTPTSAPTLLPRRDRPHGLKLVNGRTLCWRIVSGPQKYTTRRVPVDQLPTRGLRAGDGGAVGQGSRNPCGGVLWAYGSFDTVNPGDLLSVVALGNGRVYRDSLPAIYIVPLPPTATPLPPTMATPVPPPTATPVPPPTATTAPDPEPLSKPTGLKVVGRAFCWIRVLNASGYESWQVKPGKAAAAAAAARDEVTPRVDPPGPCGGAGWEFDLYTSIEHGDKMYVKALGDDVRWLDSEEEMYEVPRPAPTRTPRPPTAQPPPPPPPATSAPPTATPRLPVFVYYNEYKTVSAGQLCQRQERRCRKTCWPGTNTCWNHGQACTAWTNAGPPSQCFERQVPQDEGA